MEIRFISSLTEDDENVFAPSLLKAIGVLLDQFPIAYTLRIETTGSQIFQHSHGVGHTRDEGRGETAETPRASPTFPDSFPRSLSARLSEGN